MNQLSVNTYVQWEAYLREKEAFKRFPKYVGHVGMIPDHGDYRVLDFYENGAKMIVNDNGTMRLLSNICRHRQAKMLNGEGNRSRITCKFHKWTYGLDGHHLTAPQFETLPCLNLDQSKLTIWNDMLFENGENLDDMYRYLPPLGIGTSYAYHSTKNYSYGVNWKTFLEVYLDDYHVELYHNTNLGAVLDCSKIKWEFGNNWSSQHAKAASAPTPRSAVYENWLYQQARYRKDVDGALWLSLYPFIAIEYYPHTAMINNIVPTGPDSCLVVIDTFYTHDVINDQAFIDAQQDAFAETADEDDELCYAMQHGRNSLALMSIDQVGPYQKDGEAGMDHFHRWYRSVEVA